MCCQLCGLYRYHNVVKQQKITFHRFPVKNEDLCKQWMEFCDLQHLYTLSKEALHERKLCSRHFCREDFLHRHSNRLKRYAVPTKGWPQVADRSTTAEQSILSIGTPEETVKNFPSIMQTVRVECDVEYKEEVNTEIIVAESNVLGGYSEHVTTSRDSLQSEKPEVALQPETVWLQESDMISQADVKIECDSDPIDECNEVWQDT